MKFIVGVRKTKLQMTVHSPGGLVNRHLLISSTAHTALLYHLALILWLQLHCGDPVFIQIYISPRQRPATDVQNTRDSGVYQLTHKDVPS